MTKLMGLLARLREWFRHALMITDPKSGQPHWTPCSVLTAFLGLIIVSFVMLWLGDKLNASGMALTRFMARTQAPLTSQFFYPEKARNHITVVMYDQEFLQGSGSAWPISYQDHADALLRVAGDPNARPKAIFLDINFGQERDDPTISYLNQALCIIKNEYKVPVFLAAMPSPDTGLLKVRTGLGDNTGNNRAPCFTLVGVDYLPDSLDGLAWSYQLSRHLSDPGWASGPPDELEQVSYRSAAMAMAQDVEQADLGEENSPIALIWGYNSAPQKDRPKSLEGCRPGRPDVWNLIPGVVRHIFSAPSPQPLCPYHQTLSMAQIGMLSEGELAPYMDGRYVIVGANVPGYNDYANSPVHQTTPGVYMHAMALDNLLTYGDEYKVSSDWTFPPSKELFWPGLLAISSVFFVHCLWLLVSQYNLPKLLVPGSWLKRFEDYTSDKFPRTLRQRLSQASASAAIWLLRILIQAVVAMGLIAALQAHFRIGMLPVVELVSMTLIAEGLGYIKKLHKLIFGEPPQSHSSTTKE